MKWLILLSFLGCAQVTSLNLKKHQFGIVPNKIIWFQVAGLEEEHLAMLRFQKSGEVKTSFEESICLGKTWNYNLYHLRNSAESSFLTQMTGKKNIKNSCEDAQLRSIWSAVKESGLNTAILENGAVGKKSLLSFAQCQEVGHTFLGSAQFYLRDAPIPGAKTFHYTEAIPFDPDSVFYNRTCTATGCSSSLIEDFKSISEKLKRSFPKFLLIVRDFSYQAALEKKDWKKAKEVLSDLEQSYGDALRNNSFGDTLILLTSGDSKFLDMPDEGRSWYDFEKESKNVKGQKSKLTNLVLASGSRAENFCGVYEDAQVFERILSGPKQQGLEFKIINPLR